MLEFDPTQRLEYWCFQEIGRSADNKPIYRRMGFNLVGYDGDPDLVMEPVNQEALVDLTNPNVATIDPSADGGRIGGFRFFDSRPYEAQSFNDGADL